MLYIIIPTVKEKCIWKNVSHAVKNNGFIISRRVLFMNLPPYEHHAS